jgi:hypothetical protein
MTMHLLGPAYTTTNNSKRKSKLTDSKFTKYAFDWRDDCKQCKRLGIKPKTLEEYVAYRQGKYKPKLRGTPMPKYNVSNHREKYPSQVDTGVTFAKKPNVYTGDRLVGIATMHKSNSVPVFSQEDAIEIASMRRG